MLVIAGLGNPGASYAGNRHNIGFMAADEIVRRHSFSPWKKKFKGEMAEGEIAGMKTLVLKPLTYMNKSGEAVQEALRFYKLTPADLVVIYDELDLAPGKLRIKTGGGAGGHNGIRSIDAHCGNAYRRVRLGIGHPGHKELVQRHVLGDFVKADQEWLEPFLDAIAVNIGLLVSGNDASFMNKVALATGGSPEPARTPGPAKSQSHIRQARPSSPSAKLPQSGPMAEMLKKLLGNKDD
ncbi:MAG: aminoacyl-tRNA hydrolase [Nitratireductor sp.]